MSNRGGTFLGYEPQWKSDDKWESIEFKQLKGCAETPVRGFPFPLFNGGILQEIWLCGEAQAWAIAWGFACEYEAVNYHAVEVRVQKFKVNYKIEWEPSESTPNQEGEKE